MHAFLLFAVGLVAMSSAAAAPQYSTYGYQTQPVAQQSYAVAQEYDDDDADHQGGDKYLPPTPTTPEPIVRKQFYVISAPDDSANEPKRKHLVLGRPQKNYRVVFIKAPQSDNANVQYSAEYAPQEDKTVIYVLSKKEKDLDASDIATPEPTEASKPEVFFIKYRTPEEAEAAQKEIQSEYDKLGGSADLAEETTAPITSIVGALDGLTPDGAYNYQQINPSSDPVPAPIAPAPVARPSRRGLAPQPQPIRQRSAISNYLPAIVK